MYDHLITIILSGHRLPSVSKTSACPNLIKPKNLLLVLGLQPTFCKFKMSSKSGGLPDCCWYFFANSLSRLFIICFVMKPSLISLSDSLPAPLTPPPTPWFQTQFQGSKRNGYVLCLLSISSWNCASNLIHLIFQRFLKRLRRIEILLAVGFTCLIPTTCCFFENLTTFYILLTNFPMSSKSCGLPGMILSSALTLLLMVFNLNPLKSVLLLLSNSISGFFFLRRLTKELKSFGAASSSSGRAPTRWCATRPPLFWSGSNLNGRLGLTPVSVFFRSLIHQAPRFVARRSKIWPQNVWHCSHIFCRSESTWNRQTKRSA